MRDENNELPGNFLSELYKWALECKCFDFFLACNKFPFSVFLHEYIYIKEVATAHCDIQQCDDDGIEIERKKK